MLNDDLETNVIVLLPMTVREALRKFESSKSLTDYLALLTEAAPVSCDCSPIWETWRRNSKELKVTPQPTSAVFDWLSRVSFESKLDLIEPVLEFSQATMNEESTFSSRENADAIAAELKEAIVAELEVVENKFKRIKASDAPYAMFVGAWPFENVLVNYPAIERSTKLIDRFVRLFFSVDQRIETPKADIHARQPMLYRFIIEDIFPVVFAAERTQTNIIQASALATLEKISPHILALIVGKIDAAKPETFPKGFTITDLAKFLPKIPASIRLRLIDSIAENLAETAGEFLDNSLGVTEALRHLLQPIFSLPDIPAFSLISYLDAFCWANAGATLGYEQVDELLKNYMSRLIDARQTRNGVSTLSIEEAGELCENVWYFLPIGNVAKEPLHIYDLAILLAPTQCSGRGLFQFNSDSLPPDCYMEYPDSGRDRSNAFLTVFHTSLGEGLHELANACLAFYLFSQPQFCKAELLADWRALGNALKIGSVLPGFDGVREAAKIALEIINKHGNPDGIDALCLYGWATHEIIDAIDLESSLEGVRSHREVELNLQNVLGKENWLKLSIDSKRTLLTAEKSWLAVSGELGFGTVDLGQIALGYIKVIEIELTHRLLSVSVSSQYLTYRKDKYGRPPEEHLTLGPALVLLRDFEKLNSQLKAQITASGLEIQEDQDLLKRLMNLNQMRNQGAHSGNMTGERFVQLREQLFKNGVLKRFIDKLGER